MKILLLANSKKDPASRFRLFQYIHHFQHVGFKVSISTLWPSIYDRPPFFRIKTVFWTLNYLYLFVRQISILILLVKASRFNVIFMNRPLLGGPKVKLLEKKFIKLFGKRIIFDFDDAIFHVANDAFYEKMIFYVSNCKLIQAGNNYLLDFSKLYNFNSFLVPTAVDLDKYIHKKSQNENTPLIIGWTGSDSTMNLCFPILKEVFEKLNKDKLLFKLLIISSSKPEFEWLKDLNWEFVKWEEESEIETLNRIDIGLMPLNNTPFENGKCGLKAIQYMVLGIPAIVSPIGVNNIIVENRINGFHAKTVEDWVSLINELLVDEDLRKEIGSSAASFVRKNYSTQKVFPNILDNVQRLINENN